MGEHVYVTVVLPDGTKSDRNRPGKGRGFLFAVAAIVIVAGFATLGSLGPSDQVAVDTTTTTSTIPEVEAPIDLENFSVSQIATGEPLKWDRVVGSATGYPLAIAEHEDVLHLFTSGEAPWADEPGGLATWRASHAEDWQPVGETVISREFHVTNVIASTEGFIAIGARPGDSHLIIWWSDDGIEWTSTEIPTNVNSPYITPRPTAAAAFDNRVAIALDYDLDQKGLLADHLAAAGIDVDLPMMSWDTRYGGEDGVELVVSGPLGIPVLTTRLEALQLSEEEYQWVMRGLDRGGESEIWVVDETGNRGSGTIPLSWVTNMVSQPDGTLFASGLRGAGLTDGFVSMNGLQWKPAEDTSIGRAISWGDRLIGVTSGPGHELLMSLDGATWEELGVSDMFPSQWGWHPVAMGAGPDGLAMTLEGRNTTGRLAREASTITVLTSDGATLSVDHQHSAFVLEVDGETHTWDRYQPGSAEVPKELEIDLANETVLFQDPETGETLAEFDFEELRRMETGSRPVQFSDVIGHHALVFSRDGSEWEIRDLEPVVGETSRVIHLEVAHGHLVTVAHEPLVDPTQNVPPSGFEIWTAALP